MKKILLIEDDELLISVLEKKLTKSGYEVSLTRNGEEGLQKMRELKPDLVLLDIIMPKMGGFEVLTQMKKEPEISFIPVIIVSNSGQPVELEEAKKLGAKDWLIKTEFDPQEVINKIVKQIGE